MKNLEDEIGFKEAPAILQIFFRSGKRDQWKEVLSKESNKYLLKKNSIK